MVGTSPWPAAGDYAVVALIDEAVCAHAGLPPVRWLDWRGNPKSGGHVYRIAPAPPMRPGMPAHGTRMAGLIAGGLDPAPRPRLDRIDSYLLHPAASWPVELQIAAALRRVAASAARVVNLSWTSSRASEFRDPLAAAVALLRERGKLLVVAAGNQSIDLDIEPQWPVCLDDPALLAVTWTDASERILDAGYGRRSVDLAVVLPGPRLSTAPPGTAPAGPEQSIHPLRPQASCSTAWCRPSASMATALVTRAALRLWQQAQWQAASGVQIAQELRRCASTPADPRTAARLRDGLLVLPG